MKYVDEWRQPRLEERCGDSQSGVTTWFSSSSACKRSDRLLCPTFLVCSRQCKGRVGCCQYIAWRLSYTFDRCVTKTKGGLYFTMSLPTRNNLHGFLYKSCSGVWSSKNRAWTTKMRMRKVWKWWVINLHCAHPSLPLLQPKEQKDNMLFSFYIQCAMQNAVKSNCAWLCMQILFRDIAIRKQGLKN